VKGKRRSITRLALWCSLSLNSGVIGSGPAVEARIGASWSINSARATLAAEPAEVTSDAKTSVRFERSPLFTAA
jgi:hypothetical protein